MAVRAKKYIYGSAFKGEPKLSDIQLVEEDLPPLKDGEILIEALFLSVDPYMRPYMTRYPVGTPMIGGQMAKVIDSKHSKYPKGTIVFAQVGWRTHTIVNPEELKIQEFYEFPKFEGLSPSLGLGYLGMPGNTSYFGFLEICKPKEGETVVVTGAAGAVGSLVGQIAKLKGCRVIGFAGSDDKCKWLEDELNFDKAINYKKGDMEKALKEAAPKGVDCYFDNVGGELSSIIIHQMNLFGRISVCGSISGYNDQEILVPAPQKKFVFSQLKMEGFIVWNWASRWFEGITEVGNWIQSGKVKYHETITLGFENMPKAFIEMLRGKNTGKAIIKKRQHINGLHNKKIIMMIRRLFSSNALKARKFLYVKPFKGEPTASNFELVEEDVPALKDGEILAAAEYLSVDPYMRPYMANYEPPCTMIGGQIAKIIESKNSKFPKDEIIFGQFGWRTHKVLNPTERQKESFQDCYILPKCEGHPTSLGLGVLGMPGNTAYFGLLELCKPKKGETIVITGAAGAVGSLVGQIGKLQGCRVIGFAGSEDKCRWLENEYGFDKAINYKSENLYKQLKAAAPKGVDCFFDNVGGEASSMIFHQMNNYGRVAVCGAISSYNSEIPKVPAPQTIFVFKQLKMEGFLVWRWSHKWMEGITEIAKWVQDGKIKYHETVTENFENMPKAFIEMLQGKNYGKAIVKV